MKKEVLVRRCMHALIALTPLYFALPVVLPVVPVRRWELLMAFFVGVSIFETIRLWKGITFFGLRPHEKNQIASFAWAAAGVTLLLWLFPEDIASGALVAMALVDPLAGELRCSGYRDKVTVSVSFVAYFALFLAASAFVGDRDVGVYIVLAIVGGIVAIPSERFKFRYVDDDFLMLVLPALATSGLAYVM
jgi:dolichol kinase